MVSAIIPVITLSLIYYSGLSSVVRRLIILEFLSFYLLFTFCYLGLVPLLGTYTALFLFLTFVIEGVVGIVSLVFFINYSGSSLVGGIV